MSHIVEFLLARITEDEAVATAAAAAQGPDWVDEEGLVSSLTKPAAAPGWHLDMYSDVGWTLWDTEGASSLCVSFAVSAHMARFDPTRVLAECAAKRAIIDLHRAVDQRDHLQCAECDLKWPCATLRILPAPYVSHPDFDSGWTVEP